MVALLSRPLTSRALSTLGTNPYHHTNRVSSPCMRVGDDTHYHQAKTELSRLQQTNKSTHVMKQFITALIIGLLFPLCSMAQEDVTKKEVQENEVTIHQDDEINNLIFGEVEAVEDFEEEHVQQQVATPQKTNKATQSTRGTVRANRVANNTAVDVMREIDHRRFIEGFRIQVVSRGNTNKDHQEVRQIGKQFKNVFKEWRVEVRLKSPRWICLAGDFKTREQAEAALKQVKKTHKFKSATIVRAKIKNAEYKGDETSNDTKTNK